VVAKAPLPLSPSGRIAQIARLDRISRFDRANTNKRIMQRLIERFVRGEAGLTAYALIAGALMSIGVGTWVVATGPRVATSAQINPLEMMANAKDLPSSVGVAQNSAATAVQPPAAVGAAANPAAPGPKFKTSHHGTKHHRKTSSSHKHKQVRPAREARVATPDLTQRSGLGNLRADIY
jgi:Flp pilus assembly pilin Flp